MNDQEILALKSVVGARGRITTTVYLLPHQLELIDMLCSIGLCMSRSSFIRGVIDEGLSNILVSMDFYRALGQLFSKDKFTGLRDIIHPLTRKGYKISRTDLLEDKFYRKFSKGKARTKNIAWGEEITVYRPENGNEGVPDDCIYLPSLDIMMKRKDLERGED